MFEYLPTALSSLNTALSIGKTVFSIDQTAKSQAQFIDFSNAIIEANAMIAQAQHDGAALERELEEVKKECMRLQEFHTEKEAYALREIAGGVFAYLPNDFMGKPENAHKYCCNCFDNFKKSTLQLHIGDKRRKHLTCHNGCPDLVVDWFIEIE